MDSVESVEKIVKYSFANKTLLKDALTLKSLSFRRLAILGESALSLALTKHFLAVYPNSGPNDLSQLRSVTGSTDTLARVALKLGLYQFRIGGDPMLDRKVILFSKLVSNEVVDPVPWTGLLDPPKVLADLVQSIAGAVYIDVNFYVSRLWEIFQGLFEPLCTLDYSWKRPELLLLPLPTLLFFCNKHGMQIDFKYRQDLNKLFHFFLVYIDDKCIASGPCKPTIEEAKIAAAKVALQLLMLSNTMNIETVIAEYSVGIDIEGAKDKSIEICNNAVVSHDCGAGSEANGAKEKLVDTGVEVKDHGKGSETNDLKEKLIEICNNGVVSQYCGTGFEIEDAREKSIEMCNNSVEIKGASKKLIDICHKRKWPEVVYNVEAQDCGKGYVCSAKIETPTEEGSLCIKGEVKKTRKRARDSSASHMIRALEISLKEDL